MNGSTDLDLSRPAPDAPGLHPTQVRRALGTDGDRPARPATVLGADGDRVGLQLLDGSTDTVRVTDPARLARVLDRADLCRLRGRPLALVNPGAGVLAVATGPAEPPAQLEVLFVQVIEGGSVVELLGHEDQPGWQLLALAGR